MKQLKKFVRVLSRYLGTMAIAALIVVAVLNSSSGLSEGTAAPDLVGHKLDGQLIRLNNFEGRPAVINFWATWCGPCLSELPALEKAFREYGDRVAFVGMTLESGGIEEIKPVVERFGLSYPILVTAPGVQKAYEVSSFPTTVILRADGTVAHSHSGPIDAKLLAHDLEPLL